MRRLLPLIAALALAACGEARDPDAAPPGSEPQPEPPPGPAGQPLSTPAALPYAGSWASSAANCADKVWIVRADSVETPREAACQWDPAAVRAEGEDRFTVQASCSLENSPEPTPLVFRGDGRNLTIEGGPFEAVPLVRCASDEG